MLIAKNNKKGFTLVELLVVIAVISIISTISVLGYKNYIINSSKSKDKALINQINRTIESEKLYGETIEYTIAYILQDMFDGNVDCSSIEYGYDIYYCDDAYEFQLMQKNEHNDKNYKNLEHFLNLKLNSSETPKDEEPNIPEDSTDNNDDTLVIDLLNIPDSQIKTIAIKINLENKTTSISTYEFLDTQLIIDCKPIETMKYDFHSPEFECEIKNNIVYFYTPGVYLVKYIENNKTDYFVFFVANEYIKNMATQNNLSIGISVNNANNSFNSINTKHTIKYSNNELVIEVEKCLTGITITDYQLSDPNGAGFESLLFQYCKSIYNKLTLIVEINGNYISANFDQASNNYIFSFKNIDIGAATTANVIYRYFGNDGIWHYSNTIKVDIN